MVSPADANHVRFGDTALNEPLRVFLDKGFELERPGQIGRQGNDVGILATQFGDARAEARARVFLVGVFVFFHRLARRDPARPVLWSVRRSEGLQFI